MSGRSNAQPTRDPACETARRSASGRIAWLRCALGLHDWTVYWRGGMQHAMKVRTPGGRTVLVCRRCRKEKLDHA